MSSLHSPLIPPNIARDEGFFSSDSSSLLRNSRHEKFCLTATGDLNSEWPDGEKREKNSNPRIENRGSRKILSSEENHFINKNTNPDNFPTNNKTRTVNINNTSDFHQRPYSELPNSISYSCPRCFTLHHLEYFRSNSSNLPQKVSCLQCNLRWFDGFYKVHESEFGGGEENCCEVFSLVVAGGCLTCNIL